MTANIVTQNALKFGALSALLTYTPIASLTSDSDDILMTLKTSGYFSIANDLWNKYVYKDPSSYDFTKITDNALYFALASYGFEKLNVNAMFTNSVLRKLTNNTDILYIMFNTTVFTGLFLFRDAIPYQISSPFSSTRRCGNT